MSQSKIYVLPITPGTIIQLIAELREVPNSPIYVVDDTIDSTRLGTVSMDFCGTPQAVHLQTHPEQADKTVAFFEGDPKLAEMLDMDGLTLSYKNFYEFLAVSGASEELLDLLTDNIMLDDPTEVYMPSPTSANESMAERILSIRPKDRGEIEKILGASPTDLDGLVAIIAGFDDAKYKVLHDAVSTAEYEAVNGSARRLAKEISQSSDLVRDICASVITENTPFTFTGASWAQKESWVAISGTTDEVKDLITEILQRSKDGSLKPEWTAEHVPYFNKGEEASTSAPKSKSEETSPEKAAVVDSVWMMAGIGAGIVVASVLTIAILRKIRS